ncbi:hypothetical protein [Bradyrhizobium sp. USDA 4011]
MRRLIKDGQLAASQLCKGAPWIIKAADLERPDVKRAAPRGASDVRRLAIRYKMNWDSNEIER